MKRLAPEGFVTMVREAIEKRKISLNQLAKRGGISAAFLSRILTRERSLPSDKAILRIARILDIDPQRLLIEAGRVSEELRSTLSRPLVPALLRATGDLSETDMQKVINAAEAIALKQRNKRKENDSGR
ncbi:MAG: helix-turn-helix transcriptional regulator [Candidatus Acidiferrales bacterium]